MPATEAVAAPHQGMPGQMPWQKYRWYQLFLPITITFDYSNNRLNYAYRRYIGTALVSDHFSPLLFNLPSSSTGGKSRGSVTAQTDVFTSVKIAQNIQYFGAIGVSNGLCPKF